MNQEFGAIQGRESSHAAQGQGTKGVATTSDSAKYIKHLCENVNHDVIKLSHVVRNMWSGKRLRRGGTPRRVGGEPG